MAVRLRRDTLLNPVDPGAPRPNATQGGSTTPPAGLTFEDAIQQYQQQNPLGAGAFDGLVSYLTGLGFQVEIPTRLGGTAPSLDKLVNKATGETWDVILDVGSPGQRWDLGFDDYWVNGAYSPTPPGGGPGRRRSDDAVTTGTAVGRDELFALGGGGYAAALAAARRQRARAGVGGRQGTILAGFGGGRPMTRPTVLGGA